MIFFLFIYYQLNRYKNQLLSQVLLFRPNIQKSIIPCLEILTCDPWNVKRALYHSVTKRLLFYQVKILQFIPVETHS